MGKEAVVGQRDVETGSGAAGRGVEDVAGYPLLGNGLRHWL